MFGKIPEIEALASTDMERKVVLLQRAFRVTGQPFVAPPGTPREQVKILQDAFRETYRDPEFLKECKKLTGDDVSPLLPENHEQAIRDMPRDREVIQLFDELIGAGPLPARR